MKKIVTALVLAVVALTAQAQTPPKFKWITLATSVDKTTAYSAAKESIQITKNDSNAEVVLVLGKITQGKQIEMYQWYVTMVDCRRGFGTLRYLNTNGEWKFNVDYANDSHTLASDTAQQMCAWALSDSTPAAPPAPPTKSSQTGTV